MDVIFIKNLRLSALIGVYDSERQQRQEILINVCLEADTRSAGMADSLAESVDYAALTGEIRSLVDQARRFTVEALAEDIADLCLRDPRVRKAHVRVEKPGAVTDAESVGVEIERTPS